jgi:hypothetical protein
MRSSSSTASTYSVPVLCAVVLGASLLGAGVGWWIGVASSPLVVIEEAECAERAPAAAEDPASRLQPVDPEVAESIQESLLSGFELAAKLGALEALAEQASRSGLAPREIAGVAVDGVPEADLPILTGMLAGVEADELAEIEDPRGFARRLAELAIEAEVEGAGEDAIDAPIELLFASDEEIQNPHVVATRSFAPDAGEIFAIARTRDLEDTQLMVRWARIGHPDLLALEPMTVDASSNWSAASHRRSGRWLEGRYQVSLYSFDGEMKPLASAVFSVKSPEQ